MDLVLVSFDGTLSVLKTDALYHPLNAWYALISCPPPRASACPSRSWRTPIHPGCDFPLALSSTLNKFTL